MQVQALATPATSLAWTASLSAPTTLLTVTTAHQRLRRWYRQRRLQWHRYCPDRLHRRRLEPDRCLRLQPECGATATSPWVPLWLPIPSVVSPASASSSFAMSGWFAPEDWGRWMPSVSAGWGMNGYTANADASVWGISAVDEGDNAESQSRYVGLQWPDVFLQGNYLGTAVGRADLHQLQRFLPGVRRVHLRLGNLRVPGHRRPTSLSPCLLLHRQSSDWATRATSKAASSRPPSPSDRRISDSFQKDHFSHHFSHINRPFGPFFVVRF